MYDPHAPLGEEDPSLLQGKSRRDEILIEGKCGRESLLAHDLEAHRIGEREALVSKTLDPLGDGASDQLNADVHPLEHRVAHERRNQTPRFGRGESAQEMTVKFSQHQRVTDEAHPRALEAPEGAASGVVVPVARACQR